MAARLQMVRFDLPKRIPAATVVWRVKHQLFSLGTRLGKDKHWLPQPRFIISLRHPVERLLSHYNWLAAMNLESRPLLKAVREEEEKGFHPDSPLPGGNFADYRRASHYSRFCPVMERLFGKENILYLRTEQLSKDRRGLLRNAFDF
jgi:hypothetical protein